MSDKPTYEQMDRLIRDLAKEGRNGKKREMKKGKRGLKQRLSSFFQSAATRQVKELEIEAIELKCAREIEKAKQLSRDRSKQQQSQKKLHGIIEKYLKE